MGDWFYLFLENHYRHHHKHLCKERILIGCRVFMQVFENFSIACVTKTIYEIQCLVSNTSPILFIEGKENSTQVISKMCTCIALDRVVFFCVPT